MRESERKLNVQDDEEHISTPVFWTVFFVIALIGIMIWFGIKNPVIFGNIRDLLITIVSIFLFLIGTALAIICFLLASRLVGARKQVDESLSRADGKVEDIAVKIEEILRKILDPFIKGKSKTAAVLHILRKKKTEE